MAKVVVCSVQVGWHSFDRVAVPADAVMIDDTVYLDECPSGTVEASSFEDVKAAADYMGVSPSTVYRALKSYDEE